MKGGSMVTLTIVPEHEKGKMRIRDLVLDISPTEDSKPDAGMDGLKFVLRDEDGKQINKSG